MAMFSSGASKEEAYKQSAGTPVQRSAAGSVIGESVKVEGEFRSEDDILIEGEVHGSIETTQDLTVGEQARIEANVQAQNMYISGEIHGNLTCTGALTLTSSAKVFGDIETGILSIETGAVLQGTCKTTAVASTTATEKPAEADSEEAEG